VACTWAKYRQSGISSGHSSSASRAARRVVRLIRKRSRLVEMDRRGEATLAMAAPRRSLDELQAMRGHAASNLASNLRVHHWQIPTFGELGELLAASDPETVGFWYDCGHVQVLHNLGFHRHQDWLTAYSERIVGVHCHDVVGLRDHLVPGLGELDFRAIADMLPEQAVITASWIGTTHPKRSCKARGSVAGLLR